MKKGILLLLLGALVVAVGLPLVAADDDTKTGDTKSGDAKSGDSKAGDTKSGDSKAGEAKAGDAKKGEAVFENCSVCHNADSTEAKVGPGLKGLFMRAKLVNDKPVTEENVRALINDGTSAMPPMGDALKPEEKDDLIAYLKTL